LVPGHRELRELVGGEDDDADDGRATTVENLKLEMASCDIFFQRAGGWGYMPWVQAQRFPFRFLPAPAAEVRNELPEKQRDLQYFHAVLDHIAGLTLKQAPHGDRP